VETAKAIRQHDTVPILRVEMIRDIKKYAEEYRLIEKNSTSVFRKYADTSS
jgi:hypothetical protein